MRDCIPIDSEPTTLVKGEAIKYINERLSNTAMRTDDITIIVILHLVSGELRSCDEALFKVHESGLEPVISHRRGMLRLGGNGVVAEITASVLFDICIFSERKPLPLFQGYEPSRHSSLRADTAIPESPLYCPRSEFFTLACSPNCSEKTYELLSDIRDLTDLFLSKHTALSSVEDTKEDYPAVFDCASKADYEHELSAIWLRVASLPYAYSPDTAVSQNWVYESCRIAALIYLTAITRQVPLSTAADPGYIARMIEPTLRKKSFVGKTNFPSHSAEVLYETLIRTDMSDCWGSMSGILYWVTLVGSAAARQSSSICFEYSPPRREEAYRAWTRQCLVMYATRVRTVLVFEHPIPVISAQKRLMRVQERIGSGLARGQ